MLFLFIRARSEYVYILYILKVKALKHKSAPRLYSFFFFYVSVIVILRFILSSSACCLSVSYSINYPYSHLLLGNIKHERLVAPGSEPLACALIDPGPAVTRGHPLPGNSTVGGLTDYPHCQPQLISQITQFAAVNLLLSPVTHQCPVLSTVPNDENI